MNARAFLTIAMYALAQHSLAATPLIWMAPGLYQIDTEGEMTNFQGQAITRQQQKGSSGDIALDRTLGSEGYTRNYKGDRPITVCVKPLIPGKVPAAPVPLAGHLDDCVEQSTKPTPDGFVHISVCRGSRTTLTARRIDNETWDLEHTFRIAPVAGGPDMSKMRPLLERAAQTGNAEQRERAAKALAQLPALQESAATQRAATIKSLIKSRDKARNADELARINKTIAVLQEGADGDAAEGRKHERWTRIAHSCAAQQK